MRWHAILRGTLVALIVHLTAAIILTALSSQDVVAANMQLASRIVAALAAAAGGTVAGRRAGSGGLSHGLLAGLLFALTVSALASAGEESLSFGRLLVHWLIAGGAGGVAGAIAINV